MGQLFSIILRTKQCVVKRKTLSSETSGGISIDKMKLAWRAGYKHHNRSAAINTQTVWKKGARICQGSRKVGFESVVNPKKLKIIVSYFGIFPVYTNQLVCHCVVRFALL